jgi:hypothetical protein
MSTRASVVLQVEHQATSRFVLVEVVTVIRAGPRRCGGKSRPVVSAAGRTAIRYVTFATAREVRPYTNDRCWSCSCRCYRFPRVEIPSGYFAGSPARCSNFFEKSTALRTAHIVQLWLAHRLGNRSSDLRKKGLPLVLLCKTLDNFLCLTASCSTLV